MDVSSRVIAQRYALGLPEPSVPGCTQWRARDAVTGGAVIVALLDQSQAEDEALAALATARHPSLPVVLDHGVDGSIRYVVTPARSGTPLRARLALRAQLTPLEVADLGSRVADALAELHSRGLVQGRLTPDTLVLDETGLPRIEDPATGGLAHPPLAQNDDLHALGLLLRTVARAADTGNLLDAPGITPQLAALIQSLGSAQPPSAADVRDVLRRSTRSAPHSAAESAWEPFAPPVDALPARRSAAVPRGLVVLVSGLVLIVAVLAAIAVATLVDRRDARQRVEAGGMPGLVTTVPAAAADPAPAVPPAVARRIRRLSVASVTTSDPIGLDGENSARAGLAVDSSRTTAWSTETYRAADMSGKLGVGLILRLAAPAQVRRLVVRAAPAGATVTVYAASGAEPAAIPAGWDVVSDTVRLGGSVTTLRLDRRRPATSLLVWVSQLPPGPGGFSVAISDLRVFGLPRGA